MVVVVVSYTLETDILESEKTIRNRYNVTIILDKFYLVFSLPNAFNTLTLRITISIEWVILF